MGIVITFPADAGARRGMDGMPREGTLLILPVVRIDRVIEEPTGNGPEQGSTPGGRRRRRARS